MMIGYGLKACAWATALAVMTAGAVSATTISFDALPDEGGALYDAFGNSYYEEDGVRVSSSWGAVANFGGPGAAHLDDSGTGFASSLTFTTGGTFSVQSFSLSSFGYAFINSLIKLKANIIVTGYLGGSVVATNDFKMVRGFGDMQTVTLGAAFAGLDSFVISLINPYGFEQCFDAPCGHFDLTSVELTKDPSPVPLPATAPLLAAGGLALAALSRRRRRV
jgi:hypothetical protein